MTALTLRVAMCGILGAGKLVGQFGAHQVMRWGLLGLSAGLLVLAAGDLGGGRKRRTQRPTGASGGDCGVPAFLVGPPLLGFIGEHFGLRLAMLPVLTLVALAFVVASALQQAPQQSSPARSV